MINPDPCFRCRAKPERRISSQFNENGNAGCPYYRCPSCRRFLAFDDEIGNNALNPIFYCGASSKQSLSNAKYAYFKDGPWMRVKTVVRKVFFSCRLGKCSYYEDGGRYEEDELVFYSAWHAEREDSPGYEEPVGQKPTPGTLAIAMDMGEKTLEEKEKEKRNTGKRKKRKERKEKKIREKKKRLKEEKREERRRKEKKLMECRQNI